MKKIILFALCLGFLNTAFAQCGAYWGTTRYGGTGGGAGSIFVTDETGQNPRIIHSFAFDFPGLDPEDQTLVESNGLLYGTATEGGTYDDGVLYSYDLSTGIYTAVVNFEAAITGSEPSGALQVGSGGIIYGTTKFDGPGSSGTLYAYDPIQDTLEILLDFSTTTFSGFNTTIYLASDGNIYGNSPNAGSNSDGLLFKLDLTSLSYTTLFEFDDDGSQDGRRVQNQLVEGTAGLLYGSTYQGGTNDDGVIFQYDYIN
ncbi:MAG: choice-of-anchor tandem repeat GloVer-containing protein, partial [Bacteroidota bacterium]